MSPDPQPISEERLAQLRRDNPVDPDDPGLGAGITAVDLNALFDEIDRLKRVLDASRIVRNAAESSGRIHEALWRKLSAENKRLRTRLFELGDGEDGV